MYCILVKNSFWLRRDYRYRNDWDKLTDNFSNKPASDVVEGKTWNVTNGKRYYIKFGNCIHRVGAESQNDPHPLSHTFYNNRELFHCNQQLSNECRSRSALRAVIALHVLSVNSKKLELKLSRCVAFATYPASDTKRRQGLSTPYKKNFWLKMCSTLSWVDLEHYNPGRS